MKPATVVTLAAWREAHRERPPPQKRNEPLAGDSKATQGSTGSAKDTADRALAAIAARYGGRVLTGEMWLRAFLAAGDDDHVDDDQCGGVEGQAR